MSKYAEPTDPYGHLIFAIGSDDDFFCYDYAELEDGTIVLHAVINSETGSFIMDAEPPTVCSKAEAPVIALGLTDQAVDWMCDNEVEHDADGWNQDIYYFYRCVLNHCEGGTDPDHTKNRMDDYLPAEDAR